MTKQRALGYAHLPGNGGGTDIARVLFCGQLNNRLNRFGPPLFSREVPGWSVHRRIQKIVSYYYLSDVLKKRNLRRAAPLPIPQSNIDAPGSSKPPAFRQALEQLIRLAQAEYGTDPVVTYSLFMLGWKKNNLPAELATQLRTTLSVLSRTLLVGPVQHAAQGDMFCYDKTRKLVLLEVDLWREFCLSGYWIRDSLLLRWAELCERFSLRIDPTIHRGVVLPYLIQPEDPEREQGLARRLYAEASPLTCVWSDRSISMATMDIDHALPFSLWHNNDLWNLLPAASAVNRSKSDKVPTPEFLRRRQDAIVSNWRFAQQIETTVFQHELLRTLGRFRPESWELDLFQHLSERAAQAIYQRGEEPWEWTV